MNASLPSRNRAQDHSLDSTDNESAWSGMNGYGNVSLRSDGPYAAAMPFSRNDLAPPSDGSNRMNGFPQNPAYGPPGMAMQGMGPPGPPGMGQRRRPSEAGSQQSSRAASVANSRSSDGTISDHQSRRYRRMETELQQHYTILRSYLKGGAQQPPRPNKARDKLLRLSPVQFHELSTDVFDELQRRQAAAPLPGREPRQKNVPPFLQPIPQFHEKRNQARQKLSSLQTSRFRDLSTDVFCELERRFPHFANPEARRRDSSRSVASRNGTGRPPLPQVQSNNGSTGTSNGFPPRSGSMAGSHPHSDNPPGSPTSSGGDFGRPMPKQFQSNTITPNKSTMIEDDDDDDDDNDHRTSPNYRRRRSSDAFALDVAVASPVSDRGVTNSSANNTSREVRSLQEKISVLELNLQQKHDETVTLRKELDSRIEDAERLNKSLREQLDRLQTDHSNMERDLRSQINAAQKPKESGIWKDKHDQLQRDHQDLQSKLEEQQKITDEVGQQGQIFLHEMRAMAEGGGGNFEREEKLQHDVHKLEEELKEWKARYARAKTQLRNVRAASDNDGIRGPDAGRYVKDSPFRSPNGIIKDVHISQFQIAIDELLQYARSSEPTAVLDKMREVVLAVRKITIDVDAANTGPQDEETAHQRTKLRSKVSATANNVITATKNFAASDGLSPVSLLDAAASHLTAAVVDLVRLVKVCPMSQEDDLDEDGFVQVHNTPDPVNGAGYFNMGHRLRKSSVVESEYSALSSPPNDKNGSGPQTDTPATSHSVDVKAPNGLGIQTNTSLGEDATELQELKIYLENQTDLLVHTIQALVTSIRNEEPTSSVQAHISAIVDIVENVLSAVEGAMEDPSSYQAELKQKATAAVKTLTEGTNRLLQAGNDPKANATGPSSKTFTQRLPPLAFAIARETKELVSKLESVEAGKSEEDFS